MKSKSFFVRIFIIFFSLYLISVSPAAVWSGIPKPEGAKIIKEEETRVNNQLVYTSIYSLAGGSPNISEFYKAKLPNFGWKLGTETSEKGITLLSFSKKDIVVNILQQRYAGKNLIFVVQASTAKELDREECPECEEKMAEFQKELENSADPEEAKAKLTDSLKKIYAAKQAAFPEKDMPGKDLLFVPRYPQSIRIQTIEAEKNQEVRLTYYTRDSLAQVLDFYRQFMKVEYWELVKEVDFQDLAQSPELPPEVLKAMQQLKLIGKEFSFKGPRGKCRVTALDQQIGSSEPIRIINVIYYAK